MSLEDLQKRLAEERGHLESVASELTSLIGTKGALLPPLAIHQHYKIFRDYVEHEDGLINNRLLWNINIQGFLFATYGFSIQKLAEVQASKNGEAIIGTGTVALRAFIITLPILGIVISFFSWKGVIAAQNAIARLLEEWEKVPKPPNGPKLPGLTGGGEASSHIAGFMAPKNISMDFCRSLACLVSKLSRAMVVLFVKYRKTLRGHLTHVWPRDVRTGRWRPTVLDAALFILVNHNRT